MIPLNKNQSIRVVLLDSGVDTHNKLFNKNLIEQYQEIHGKWLKTQEYVPLHGHGTGVASILQRQAENIELKSFVLFKDKLSVKVDTLIHALEKIERDIPCDIIHMSLGVRYYHPDLHAICNRLVQKGIVLVAACHNNGGVSFPAGFPCVIGVGASWKCLKSDDFAFVENGTVVNLLAKGGNQRVLWLDNTYVINRGSSFAAPYVTAKIAEFLFAGIHRDNILESFQKVAKHVIPCTEATEPQAKHGSIHNAAIFPYNKETSSLMRYADMLDFSVTDLYDIRLSGKLAKQINAGNKKMYCIKNIEDCLWEDFDTLILGHVQDMERLSKREWKEFVLTKCLEHKINVYAFDTQGMEEWKEKFFKAGLWLSFPNLKKNWPGKQQFGKMFSMRTPVLAVLGTSNQQGKFTLQLELRKRFLRDGYKLCQLGSEPESLLFDMNEVFPFGFESDIDLSGKEFISYLNASMFSMEQLSPEIILVGSQAGTIPMQWDNIENFTLDRLYFLLGTHPDGILLCVNYHDKVSEIQRSILAIESLGKCKVIACCLFPLGFETEWDLLKGVKREIDNEKLKATSAEIASATGKLCFIMDDTQMENIYRSGIEFFRSNK